MSSGQDFISTIGAVMRIADSLLPHREEFIGNDYDLIETDKEIRIYVEVPGVAPGTIGVDFFNNELKLTGKKVPYVLEFLREPTTDSTSGNVEISHTFHKNGIKKNDVKLRILLPLAITNRENVKVSLKQGILSIIIDKEAEGRNSFSVELGES